MPDKYIENQIKKVIEENKNSKYSLKIKILGDNGGTNWCNVTNEEILEIVKIFAERNKKDNSCGGYGCKEEDEG